MGNTRSKRESEAKRIPTPPPPLPEGERGKEAAEESQL